MRLEGLILSAFYNDKGKSLPLNELCQRSSAAI
ncbi:hypothetical protein PMI18_02663 [Pseudomonas sp. GM102]|nr:hypothetical protein PMI18_02663 [Pseudomonas sp. GM102]